MTVNDTTIKSTRLVAIDAVRGFVLLCMLVDHARDTFFFSHELIDPMNVLTTAPELFFTRKLSDLCAPAFILLTGISAYLFSLNHGIRATSEFLLKRGIFLIFLEFTFVDFAWSGEFPPNTLNLQIMWCIGICMIALSMLLRIPQRGQFCIAVLIIASHNLLDNLEIAPHTAAHVIWSVLHKPNLIESNLLPPIIVTYPVLPWIGVILLGYSCGYLYSSNVHASARITILLRSTGTLLAAFLIGRYLNLYGEAPWAGTDSILRTAMSFLSATKYPPSLMFLLQTLACTTFLLLLFEKFQNTLLAQQLATLGSAPMFFYLLHLYALKILYLIAQTTSEAGNDSVFELSTLGAVWVLSIFLGIFLFFPTRLFTRLKQSRRDLTWLKYF